jgi:hypothetical protein
MKVNWSFTDNVLEFTLFPESDAEADFLRMTEEINNVSVDIKNPSWSIQKVANATITLSKKPELTNVAP